MTTFVLDPRLREQLRERSNWRGALAVARDWGLLVLAFAISFAWPNPLAFLVTTLLLCGVHVGLVILMHEAAHRSLFANARLNDGVGQYLCALPNFNHMPMYRSYHMAHHRHAGTPDDPDAVMVERYPIARASLRRKLLRDASGISGGKFIVGLVGMVAGYWKFQQNGLVERVDYAQPQRRRDHALMFLRNGGAVAIGWQLALFGTLLALGHGLYYLFWVAAFLIPFPLFMRVRVLADHAVVHDLNSTSAIDHARSTRANWLEKLLIVPHNEHYHLEHHLLPSAPFWNLPKLHAILEREGVIPPANTASGLLDVLRRAAL
ncbi:MAG: fatty acid desaturase family protein [Nevskia sp.]